MSGEKGGEHTSAGLKKGGSVGGGISSVGKGETGKVSSIGCRK